MKVSAALVTAILVISLPLFGNASRMDEMALALIQFTAALGLAVAFGMAGEFVICQASLVGVGGYVFGYLRLHGCPFLLALLSAAAAGASAGTLLGAAAVRVRGHYFAILTLAAGVVMYECVIRFAGVTGGAVGLSSVPPVTGALGTGTGLYALISGVAIIAALYVYILQRTPLGRGLIAARRSPGLAAASGINTSGLKVAALAVSGTIAAVAGALHVQFMTSFTPENVSIERSVILLLIVALAGRGSIIGVAVATWISEIVPGYLRVVGEVRFALLGFIILMTILLAPGGIGAPLERIFDRAVRVISKRVAACFA